MVSNDFKIKLRSRFVFFGNFLDDSAHISNCESVHFREICKSLHSRQYLNTEFFNQYKYSDIYHTLRERSGYLCDNYKVERNEYNWRSPKYYNSTSAILDRNGNPTGARLPAKYWYSNGAHHEIYADGYYRADSKFKMRKVFKQVVDRYSLLEKIQGRYACKIQQIYRKYQERRKAATIVIQRHYRDYFYRVEGPWYKKVRENYLKFQH